LKTGKSQTARPAHPNVGLELAYRRRLDALVDEMNASLLYWLSAAYRANEPATGLAMDRSVADILNAIMKRLARRWTRRFDDAAKSMGEWFAKSSAARSDAALKASLKRAGFSVKFQATPGQIDAVQAVLAENVGLIRSIASEHLTDVQGILMRSVSTGRDLGAMTDELQKQFGVSKRRAALIARDQNNKATAVIVKTRQQELGITHATWQHSHGGKHPRPEHVKANGKPYEIAKGMFLEGKWVWPGTEINCRCVSRSIVPGLER
jgi:SPP1 gp7 family putative phage head morphogenesis protein